jgi:hypothetical protein
MYSIFKHIVQDNISEESRTDFLQLFSGIMSIAIVIIIVVVVVVVVVIVIDVS